MITHLIIHEICRTGDISNPTQKMAKKYISVQILDKNVCMTQSLAIV